MTSTFAVVVTVHDGADGLRTCLDSLLAQPRRPDQVVLVDDGSGDGAVADEYAAAHDGWQVLRGEHGGPGRGRNLGADLVTADLLAFVDGDDVVPPGAYAALLTKVERSGADLASAGSRTVLRTELWRRESLRFAEKDDADDADAVRVRAHTAAKGVDLADLRACLPALPGAADEERTAFVERAGKLVRDTDEDVLRALPPVDRLLWWLVGKGHLPQVLEVVGQEVAGTLDRTVTRRPLRLTANLPFRGDRTLGVPGWVYDVTNSQPMRVRVDDARWEGQALVLEGRALVDQVPMTRRWASRLRVEARDRATTRSFLLPVTRVRDEERTGATDYTWCGFVTNVDVATLAAASQERVARFHFLVHLTTASARRGRGVRSARPGRASTPGARLLPDGTLAVAGWGERGLELAVHRDPTYLASVDVDGDGLALGLRLGRKERRAADAGRLDLVLTGDGADDVRVEVPSSGRVVLAPGDLGPRPEDAAAADRAVRLVTRAARDGDPDGLPVPLLAGPDVTEVAVPHEPGELAVDVDVDGSVRLRDAAVTPRADAVDFEDGHLVLSGTASAAVSGPVRLVRGDDTHHGPLDHPLEYPLEQDEDTRRWTVRLPLDGDPGPAALRRLPAGRYRVRCPEPAAGGERPLRVTGDLPGRGRDVATSVEGVLVEVCWTSDRQLVVDVRPGG